MSRDVATWAAWYYGTSEEERRRQAIERMAAEAEACRLRPATEPTDSTTAIYEDLWTGHATPFQALERLLAHHSGSACDPGYFRDLIEEEERELSAGEIAPDKTCEACGGRMTAPSDGQLGRPRKYCKRLGCVAYRKMPSFVAACRRRRLDRVLA